LQPSQTRKRKTPASVEAGVVQREARRAVGGPAYLSCLSSGFGGVFGFGFGLVTAGLVAAGFVTAGLVAAGLLTGVVTAGFETGGGVAAGRATSASGVGRGGSAAGRAVSGAFG
jgi:hypothetical protein